MRDSAALRFLPFLLAAGLFASVASCASKPKPSNEIVRYFDWLTNGVKSGSHELTINAEDRTRTVLFEFNDRGRGPAISEVTHLDGNGKRHSLSISGHSYMGAAVDEQLIISENRVSWLSTLESGESGNTEAFYLANDGSFEQLALLTRKLLASETGQIQLLPGGTASLRKLDELSIPIGEQSHPVTLYAVNGLGFQPEFIWLDAHQELFGISAVSNALIPRGRGHGPGYGQQP